MTLLEQIAAIPDCELLVEEDLTSKTTMRLQSRGDFILIRTKEALRALLPLLKHHQRKYLVLGWGANQILPRECTEFILKLDLKYDPQLFSELRDEYVLPASIGLNHLTAHAMKFGIKGWEVFTGIPASLGGAIYMNAGTNLGEIGPVVASVEIVNGDGELRSLQMNERSFSYRRNTFVGPGDVIVGATLKHFGVDESLKTKIQEYLEFRKSSQPLTTKNCGCVFKNPMKNLPAGKLIDLLGMKGLEHGGLRVSGKHANFIENTGGANWDHFEALTSLIRFEMDHFYGIEFELEVKIPYT